MTLSETFSNPLDPERSIQLNNRYWPGDKFSLVGIIADAEAMLSGGELVAAARHLHRLKKCFPEERLFEKFLRRLHRLRLYRSQFGYVTGRLELDSDAIAANRYSGPATRAEYALARRGEFAGLIGETVRIYKSQYGGDLVRTRCTVRFAKPDERQIDVTGHGPLSDVHNDEYKGISTIVYLNDVKEESDGAFAFVEGSHLVPRSLVLSALHQCVAFDMKLDIGRATPEQIGCVPLEFRGSPALGNFLDDDKVKVVKASLKVLNGPVGTFVSFNGQYLLHRGGKPLSGSRTAAFLQPIGALRHKAASVGSLLYAKANK